MTDADRAALKALVELSQRLQQRVHDDAIYAGAVAAMFSKAAWEHNAGVDWPHEPDDDSYQAFENCIHPDCKLARSATFSALIAAGLSQSQLTPTTMCPDGEPHVLRCIRCELPAAGLSEAPARYRFDQVLQISALVNAYHNDGTTLTAAETLKAIADVLGPAMGMSIQSAPPAPTAEPTAMKQCVWMLDDAEAAVWETSCDQTWQFVDGGPRENKTRFCHYCGGAVITRRSDRRAAALASPAPPKEPK